MAEVVWPRGVADQISEIVAYIRKDDPAAAERVASPLFAQGESLAAFPHRGRPASRATREMTGVWPYILRYRVQGDIVTILHIQHGARRPLP